jgi:RNA-directed DNA polymerase
VDRGWLVKFVEHRIGDERVVRHVKKWLNAGVLEDGKRMHTTDGTPQGSSVSPILANIYLHYAFDLWAHQWRKKKARGEVIVVRFADDILMGFQYRADAERFRRELEERMGRFKLELHPEKTRLMEFGRFAAENRKKRGEGKPETFDFLGFTHICGKKRNGKFTVLRKTIRKRMTAKLKEVKANLKACMHDPVPVVGKWLASVLRGHYQYYGVPRNSYSMSAFRTAVVRLWYQAISRRSQNGKMPWQRMSRLAKIWLPTVRITHPYPEQRLRV